MHANAIGLKTPETELTKLCSQYCGKDMEGACRRRWTRCSAHIRWAQPHSPRPRR